MAIKRIKQGPGLWTDASSLDVPEGALLQAENVLLHRPGIVGPRPGFGDTTDVAARTTDFRPIRLYPYAGKVLVQSYDGTDYRIEQLDATAVLDADCPPPDTSIVGTSNAAEARGSLYVCSNTGVRKFAGTDNAPTLAGSFTHYLPIVVTTITGSAARHAIDTNSIVAYRYCWVVEDANGYVRRSAPSARALVTGTQSIVRFDRVYLPDNVVEGDRLEIYRSESVTSTGVPPEELYLAVEYTVTDVDEANGYITEGTIDDDVPDAKLGAALYTNPSQGGIVVSNETPPTANQVAWWAGCMWYANGQARHVLPVTINACFDPSDESFDRVGWHWSLQDTCSFSNGGTAITSTSTSVSGGVTSLDINGLKVGQYVSSGSNGPSVAGTDFQASTKISRLRTFVVVDNASLTDGHTLKVYTETFTWKTTATLPTHIQIGATSNDSATNAASVLDGYEFDDGSTITASSSTDTVEIEDTDQLHSIPVAYTTASATTAAAIIDIDKTTLAGGSGKLVQAHDWCTINGVEFYAGNSFGAISHLANLGAAAGRIDKRLVSWDSDPENASLGFQHEVSAYTIVEDASFGTLCYADQEQSLFGNVGDGAFVLIRQYPTQGELTFQCTVRPEAFRPHAAQSRASEDQRKRHRVYWSKPQEPEAVPLVNYTDIGRDDKNITALVPLDNALLVFKEDGIWRITGSAPNLWVVDEVDTAKRLLAPSATAVLDNICYAWTDRGVFQIAESGIAPTPISAPIGDVFRDAQRLLPLGVSSAKRAFYAVAHQRLGLVAFALGTATGDDFGAWYVFHRGTGAWSKWTHAAPWRCAAFDPASDKLVCSLDEDAWTVVYERVGAGAGYDRSVALDPVTSPAPGSVTFGGSELPVAPKVGDVWKNGGASFYWISAVSYDSGSGDYTITFPVEDPGTGLAGIWFEGFDCALLWAPQHLAGLGQRWQEMHAEFGEVSSPDVLGTFPVYLGGAAHFSSSPAVVTSSLDGVTYSRPLRVGLPRDVVRTPHLYPYALLHGAAADWELLHLYLHHTTTSRRVWR